MKKQIVFTLFTILFANKILGQIDSIVINQDPKLSKALELKKIVKIVGYSGHFAGIDDALIAIVNEAQYIEKHFYKPQLKLLLKA